MEVGTNILAHRLAGGLTQGELARRALLTPANLSAIENGRRDLTVATLLRIAHGLKVAPAVLFSELRRPHSAPGRFAVDAIARAVISGRRDLTPAHGDLADGLAWICRPSLRALGVPGVRHASRRKWRRAEVEWDRDILDALQARTRKLLAADAWRGLTT